MGILISLEGEEGVGKSHFGLASPEPIYFFNFDWGIELLLPKFQGKKIHIYDYPLVLSEEVSGEPEKWRPLYSTFMRDIAEVFLKDKGTVVIDTATTLWKVVHSAYLESLPHRERLMPYEYAEPNYLMESVLQRIKLSKLNGILIQKLRDVYIEDKRTKEKELDGFRLTTSLVDIALRLELIAEEGGFKQYATIRKSRYNFKLRGLRIANPTFESVIKVNELASR